MSADDLTLIARHISPETADALIAAFGGADIYVPRRLGPDHALVRAVGTADARAIVALLGAGHLRVPLGTHARQRARAARILTLSREGHSARKIARELGCDVRTVYNWRARAKRSGL